MARRKPVLTVVLAPKAEDELDQIYRYNLKERGLVAADNHIAFIRAKIASLANDYEVGNLVKSRPNLYFITIKRGGRWKDGQVAVYAVFEGEARVEILHIFHTKQDWENKV